MHLSFPFQECVFRSKCHFEGQCVDNFAIAFLVQFGLKAINLDHVCYCTSNVLLTKISTFFRVNVFFQRSPRSDVHV